MDVDENVGADDAQNSEISVESEGIDESHTLEDMFLNAVRNVRQIPFELPATVSKIECPNGTIIYLIGTAHFSRESIADVRFVMQNTLPDMVVVELCRTRSNSMLLSDEEIKLQIQENSLTSFVKNLGVSNGIVQYLLLRFTNYIMEQIGTAPGGEFRAAFQEASKQPHCHLILGDRPIRITLQRAMDALNIWQKTKILFSLLFSFEKITPEDIEDMKREDLLEKLCKTLAGDYPELTRAILEERDLYLARSIWEVSAFPPPVVVANTQPALDNEDSGEIHRRKAGEETDHGVPTPQVSCCPKWPSTSELPRVVVAVVGIGHVAGIKRAWDTAVSIDKSKLMMVKPTPRYWTFFKWGSKAVIMLSLAYGTCLLGKGFFRIGCCFGEHLLQIWPKLAFPGQTK